MSCWIFECWWVPAAGANAPKENSATSLRPQACDWGALSRRGRQPESSKRSRYDRQLALRRAYWLLIKGLLPRSRSWSPHLSFLDAVMGPALQLRERWLSPDK